MVRQAGDARFDALAAGAARLGFAPMPGFGANANPGDLLVIWNRYGTAEAKAAQADRAGCPVLVMENGYLGEGFYALALDQHNGCGDWPVGGAARLRKLGLKLTAWRQGGDHVLLLPQRGIGPRGVAMPYGWAEQTLAELRTATGRPVLVRPHPGRTAPAQSLDEALAGAWCCVTWGSGAALKAIVAGKPVFHALAGWIGAPAARAYRGAASDLEDCFTGARRPMLQRLAWAQWSLEEIASGEPIERLLLHRRQTQGAQGL